MNKNENEMGQRGKKVEVVCPRGGGGMRGDSGAEGARNHVRLFGK